MGKLKPGKICKSDSECDSTELCSFNPNDMNHYCVNNSKNDLYSGCLKNKNSINNYIESKSKDDYLNMKKCIEFARRQKNPDGMPYNYMLFKQKKNVFVDTTNIIIYLKCGNEILAAIPYNDYFTIKCDDSQENCVLTAKKSLYNFIQQNTRNCQKKIYLEVTYECENEQLKNTKKIPVYLEKYDKIEIKLTCPINPNDERFQSKCVAAYIDEDMIQSNKVLNREQTLYDCKNPAYSVPYIVDDMSKYKKVKNKYNHLEVSKYDDKINSTVENLKKLKAQKYMRLHKIQTGKDIDYDTAYQTICKQKFNIDNNENENWTLFKNYDAIKYLLNEQNPAVKLHGMVYSINEAVTLATQKNESFFVWYNNSYEEQDFASKLFFVDIFSINNDLLNKSEWAHGENVITGLFKFEEFSAVDDAASAARRLIQGVLSPSDDSEKVTELQKSLIESEEYNNILTDQYKELIKNNLNLTNYNMNDSIITNLDNQITTLSQAIKMGNYEININDNIIYGLQIMFVLIFLIGIGILIYTSYKGSQVKVN
jgi:hypothetical protein